MELELEINRLGAQGDGVAEGPEGPIFVPFTLPGERVRVAVDGDATTRGWSRSLSRVESGGAGLSPFRGVRRVRPPAYGGRRLSQLEARPGRGRAEIALSRRQGRGGEARTARCRRRASLAIGRGATGFALGYHRARSHELIDIEVCPVLSFRIEAALPRLRKALTPLIGGKREAKVGITETNSAGMLWLMVSVPFRQPWPHSRGKPLRLA